MGWFFSDQRRQRRSLFEVSEAVLDRHVARSWYGDFELTDAVRPAHDLQIVPVRGVRADMYSGSDGVEVPVLLVSETKEHLLPLFYDLLNAFTEEAPSTVDVVLESSHGSENGSHTDYYACDTDHVVLRHHLVDFEHLLLNDGCFGIAVCHSEGPIELQWDEHKLFIIYGYNLWPFLRVLEQYHVPLRPNMKVISEGLHIHQSSEVHKAQFERLRDLLDAEPD